MKSKNIIGILLTGIVLYGCEKPVGPVNPRPIEDTIPSIDTIMLPDTIICSDTIPIINDTIIIGTGDEPGEYLGGGDDAQSGPLACLTLVKFYNPGQENKVIVQHPFKKYNGIDGCYEYYLNKGLYLNVLPKQCPEDAGCGLSSSLVEWADNEIFLHGTSPYIPLADGYYLIDWKWHQLCPLSAIAEALPNAYYDNFADHIQKHVFMTAMDWDNLQDLNSGYDTSISVQPIKGIEIIRVWTLELVSLFDGHVESDPYVCWNNSVYYYDGMCLENTYMYYLYGDCSPHGRTYRSYITYCDSLQSVYQQRLIELINTGQIKEVGF